MKADDLSDEISDVFQLSGHQTTQVWDEYRLKEVGKNEKFDLIFIKDRPKVLYLKIPKIYYTTYPVLFLREVKNCVIFNNYNHVMNPNFLDYSVQYLLLENMDSRASSLTDRE